MVINRAWQVPSECQEENGLQWVRRDEGDQGGNCCIVLVPGQRGEKRTDACDVHNLPH